MFLIFWLKTKKFVFHVLNLFLTLAFNVPNRIKFMEDRNNVKIS